METVVCLVWMAVVPTLGMARTENGLLTLLNSLTRGIITELAKYKLVVSGPGWRLP